MVQTTQLSSRLSDLNVALNLFKEQIDNVMAVSNGRDKIYSTVSNAIREYVSMYQGLQMLHSTAETIQDLTEKERRKIALTPFYELRDILVKLKFNLKPSSVDLPLIYSNTDPGLTIKVQKAVNIRLRLTSNAIGIELNPWDKFFEESVGSVEITHTDGAANEVYANDFGLHLTRTVWERIAFASLSIPVPAHLRSPFSVNHTVGAPVFQGVPWCINLLFNYNKPTSVALGREIVFRDKDGSRFLSISKFGSVSNTRDPALPAIQDIIIGTNRKIPEDCQATIFGLNTSGFFGTPINTIDSNVNNVHFSDAPIVAVTQTAIDKLLLTVGNILEGY